tara:strand:+ start:1466 stop:1621 length:156 start_codon:yes stop_codon:yes gene_type:complete
MSNENRKLFSGNGGAKKGMFLREMNPGKVTHNAPFSKKTRASNRQKPKKRK